MQLRFCSETERLAAAATESRPNTLNCARSYTLYSKGTRVAQDHSRTCTTRPSLDYQRETEEERNRKGEC